MVKVGVSEELITSLGIISLYCCTLFAFSREFASVFGLGISSFVSVVCSDEDGDVEVDAGGMNWMSSPVRVRSGSSGCEGINSKLISSLAEPSCMLAVMV